MLKNSIMVILKPSQSFLMVTINIDYDKNLYDFSEYSPIENIPKRLAILKRNEYMVNESDVLIAYIKYTFGGSAKILKYDMIKKENY